MVELAKTQRIGLVAVSVVMFAIAATTPRFNIIPIIVALLCLLVLASSLSRAGRLSGSLRRFQGRAVDIRVWGEPLPHGPDSSCQIKSVRAFGAGLLLFVAAIPTHSSR
jgi:hypothetical protein